MTAARIWVTVLLANVILQVLATAAFMLMLLNGEAGCEEEKNNCI